jgi:ketosteroid isomerase-like protein
MERSSTWRSLLAHCGRARAFVRTPNVKINRAVPNLRSDRPAETRDFFVEDAMASTQSEVRALLDSRSEAIRTKDIDQLMSFYSPDIVYFDLVPGLQYTGSPALRPRFLEWFDGYEGSIGQEIRDLNISASGDIAVAYMLIRASGTLKNGHEVGFWVRATSCCQRSNHKWSITHEHVSLPVDVGSGSAAMDLVP